MLPQLTKIATPLPTFSRGQTRQLGLQATASAISQASRGPRLVQVKDTVSVIENSRLAAQIGATTQITKDLGEFATGLQVAEQALSDIAEKLTEIRTVVEQAMSPERSFIELAHLNVQFEELLADIDQIVEETTFNGYSLLDGNGSQSDLDLTQSYAVSDVGTSIGTTDGIETYFIAAQPSGLSDGDTIQVEYSATTGLFTVTNTTTGDVATATGPSSSPDDGEYAYVNVVDFGLTIELNEDFDPTQDNSADGGDLPASQFTIQVSTISTLTTRVSDTLTLDANLGASSSTENDLSVGLLPATVADLAPGLVFDDISSRLAAGRALANVMAAETQLDEVRTQLAADMGRLGVAGQRLEADTGIHARDRAEVLSRQDSVDLVSAINARVLSDAAPLLSQRALQSSRQLLTTLASRVEPPARAPAEPTDEETASESTVESEPRPSEPATGQAAAPKPQSPVSIAA